MMDVLGCYAMAFDTFEGFLCRDFAKVFDIEDLFYNACNGVQHRGFDPPCSWMLMVTS